jgi:hypothetical protein
MKYRGEEDPLYASGLTGGLSEGWPWFLDGMRPQGFMGRAFVRKHCRLIGSSPDLNRWGSDQYLLSALLFGSDLPGNLVIGDHPIEVPEFVDQSCWPDLAREAIRGNPAGSSAGGEQPKFSSGIEIVKFARFDGEGGRWADLLVAESLAADVLAGNGIAVAHTRIMDQDGFRFLAIRRFDRTERGGRHGMHSLEALDGAFIGEGGGAWPDLAASLHHPEGLLGFDDLDAIKKIWNFGRAIGNTDMHLGNLSFLETDRRLLTVAPVYDMLPMAYIPTSAGIPEAGDIDLPVIEEDNMAKDFWQRVAEDTRISASFRNIAKSHLSRVQGIGI